MIPGYPLFIVTQSCTEPGPPKSGELNTPVRSAPSIPPTACTPNTSSASSAPSSFFRPFTPHRHTRPAARPITNAPGMPTLPAAGVIATKPATAPEAAPTMLGLPLNSHSPNIHEHRARRREVGVHERERCRAVGLEGRPGVEAEPARPQQSGSYHGHGDVVRGHRF